MLHVKITSQALDMVFVFNSMQTGSLKVYLSVMSLRNSKRCLGVYQTSMMELFCQNS